MATKISVDGVTISVNNNKRSSEAVSSEAAYVIQDSEELYAQATEAYVMSEYMYKAYESLNARSTEANESNQAQPATKFGKFKEAAKRIFTAIADFFKRIGAYIISFFKSNALMFKAKTIAKTATELKAKNVSFPTDAYVDIKFVGINNMSNVVSCIKYAEDLSANLKNQNFKMTENAQKSLDNLNSIIKNTGGSSVRLANFFKNWDEVINACTGNSTGIVGICKSIISSGLDSNIKKMEQKNRELANNDNATNDDVKSSKITQTMANAAVKGYTLGVKCLLSVAQTACSVALKTKPKTQPKQPANANA